MAPEAPPYAERVAFSRSRGSQGVPVAGPVEVVGPRIVDPVSAAFAPPVYGSVTATRSTAIEGPLDFGGEAAAVPRQVAEAAAIAGGVALAGLAPATAPAVARAAAPLVEAVPGAVRAVAGGAGAVRPLVHGAASRTADAVGRFASGVGVQALATVGAVGGFVALVIEDTATGTTFSERRRPMMAGREEDMLRPPGGSFNLTGSPGSGFRSNEPGNPMVLP